MIKKIWLSLLSVTLLLTASCASSQPKTDALEQEDSLESFNRAMFKFNYKLDKYILKPVAKGYRAITTHDVRVRFRSAFSNLREPISAVNQVLQGQFKQSGISTGRFVINTTLGLGGTFDVATAWGLEREYDNFERTLAKWCVKDGPYIVLPFIGSTTPRAFAGTSVDAFVTPVYWLTEEYEDGIYAYFAAYGLQTIVAREAYLDISDDLESNSVDYYTTMKSAYLQNKSDMPSCYNNENKNVAYDFNFEVENEDETFDEMEAK